MKKTTVTWLWLFLLLILDILIPWFVLSSVQKMSGAFLFSTVWGALHGPSGQVRERRRELLANPLR